MEYPVGFRQRRALNWVLAGLMYSLFYMARYNFAAINARLADLFGWTNLKIGIVSAVATWVYGISVFFNGPLADKIGGRRAILIGACGAAAFNIAFGCMHFVLGAPAVWAGEDKARHVVQQAQIQFGMTGSTVIALFAVLWACNHYFQSFGALSIVKINAAWFHIRERGFFAGIFGILIRFGLILAFVVSPLILLKLPWQWVFWTPAALLVIAVVANYVFLRNTPKDAGLPEYETGDESAEEKATPATLGMVLRKVFANPAMWIIAGASLMVGMVRRSVIDDWWPKYFANVHHVDPKHYSEFAPYEIAAWGIAIAGIIGGLVFGLASDRIFGGRRAPVVVIAFGGMAALLVVAGMADRLGGGPYAQAGAIVLLSFFVNGAHGMVGGAASMDFGGRKAAATAAGLIDGVQYLIAGPVVGLGMGRLLDAYGWSVWQWAPLPFALAGALLMSRLWNVLPKGAVSAPPSAVRPDTLQTPSTGASTH